MRNRSGFAVVVLAAVLASGCLPVGDSPESVIMNTLMLLVGAAPKSAPAVAAAPARQKLTGELAVAAQVSIGGLSGTYDVTLGPYGQFTGTAQIVGKKAAKLTDEGSPELLAAVHGILLDAHGEDVTVTAAKAKVSGRQTTGGVRKRYKGKITFAGTIAAGANAGASVKGKIKTKGDLED